MPVQVGSLGVLGGLRQPHDGLEQLRHLRQRLRRQENLPGGRLLELAPKQTQTPFAHSCWKDTCGRRKVVGPGAELSLVGTPSARRFPLTPLHHILVVDDHGDGRGEVAALLNKRGFYVGEASDGKSAFGVMISGPEPSVVILDLTTPVRSAPELLYLMQRNSRLSEIPVIVLNDHRLMPEFRYKMPIAHLYKPYEPEGLLAAIERCIHLHRRDDHSLS